MFEGLRDWAPLPLRGVLGIGLIIHGGIKLFGEGGHENIAHLITQLGVPFPDLMGWVVGLVEFGGGLGILLGAFIRISAGLNALNVGGLLVLATWAGGIPDPMPGGDPLPTFQEAYLILAGVLALLLFGAGNLAVNELLRHRERQEVGEVRGKREFRM